MTSKQMKDLLSNMSKKTGINAQILQRNYMMERLLERIARSEYKNNFILKGGMLVAAMVGIDSRSTMDMDASIKNLELSADSIRLILEKIITLDIGDDVSMSIKEINEIREEFEYSCFRVSLEAQVGNASIPMKVDISTGDSITPREVAYQFDLLLENRTIEVWAYNLETILAEKLETILSRDIANTRMRDFYDVYILVLTRYRDINMNILKNALEQTAARRGTELDYSALPTDINRILKDEGVARLWTNYQKKFPYAKDISWKQVGEKVKVIFMTLCQ